MGKEAPLIRLRKGDWLLTTFTSEMLREQLGDNASWDDAQLYLSINETWGEEVTNARDMIHPYRYFIGDCELIPDDNGVIANYYNSIIN